MQRACSLARRAVSRACSLVLRAVSQALSRAWAKALAASRAIAAAVSAVSFARSVSFSAPAAARSLSLLVWSVKLFAISASPVTIAGHLRNDGDAASSRNENHLSITHAGVGASYQATRIAARN